MPPKIEILKTYLNVKTWGLFKYQNKGTGTQIQQISRFPFWLWGICPCDPRTQKQTVFLFFSKFPEPQCGNIRQSLFCTVTRKTISKSRKILDKHVHGKRFLKKFLSNSPLLSSDIWCFYFQSNSTMEFWLRILGKPGLNEEAVEFLCLYWIGCFGFDWVHFSRN